MRETQNMGYTRASSHRLSKNNKLERTIEVDPGKAPLRGMFELSFWPSFAGEPAESYIG